MLIFTKVYCANFCMHVQNFLTKKEKNNRLSFFLKLPTHLSMVCYKNSVPTYNKKAVKRLFEILPIEHYYEFRRPLSLLNGKFALTICFDKKIKEIL